MADWLVSQACWVRLRRLTPYVRPLLSGGRVVMQGILIWLLQTQDVGCPGHGFSAELDGPVVASCKQPSQASVALRLHYAEAAVACAM